MSATLIMIPSTMPATLVVGFTTGGRIFAVFQFSQRISRSSDSLCIYLFAFYVSKAIETKGFRRHCIDLFILCCSLFLLGRVSSPQLLVLSAMSPVKSPPTKFRYSTNLTRQLNADLIPQLPGGETNDNENAKARKTNDLLTTFTTKKKIRMDTE